MERFQQKRKILSEMNFRIKSHCADEDFSFNAVIASKNDLHLFYYILAKTTPINYKGCPAGLGPLNSSLFLIPANMHFIFASHRGHSKRTLKRFGQVSSRGNVNLYIFLHKSSLINFKQGQVSISKSHDSRGVVLLWPAPFPKYLYQIKVNVGLGHPTFQTKRA